MKYAIILIENRLFNLLKMIGRNKYIIENNIYPDHIQFYADRNRELLEEYDELNKYLELLKSGK